jgi:hypothetical protein
MLSTGRILRKMATVINTDGLHTGEQFGHRGVIDQFDICALAYIVAEDKPAPDVFFTDQAASMELLERSEPAMQALRVLSASIADYEVPDTAGQPDVIEHVFNWTAAPGIGQKTPPTTAEIVGRLIRASETQKPDTYCTGDRCADCTPDEECCEATCGCCPRVDEHDHCRLAPGSEEDSKYCDQHGEGWLFDRSPEAERKYELLRRA